MPEPLPLLYWDACVFLSYINGTPEHLRDIDPLLERSGQDFQIITSAITIVEVSFGKIEQDGKVLDPIIEEKIDALDKRQATLEDYYSKASRRASAVSAGDMTYKDIQMALKNAAFYDGSVDGVKNKETESAIRSFQKANGLKVDGIVGKKTRNLLIKYL